MELKVHNSFVVDFRSISPLTEKILSTVAASDDVELFEAVLLIVKDKTFLP